MNMDYNLYKIFLYLYEEKSISKTANKLYVSQPAISYSLKELENQLGYTLFYRNSKGIEPTLEAKELYNYISAAFNILQDAEEHIKNLNDLNVGEIRIGIPSNVCFLYLSKYILSFRKEYPGVKFSIISKSMEEMIEMLETRKLDIIIGTTPINSEKKLTKIVLAKLHNCFAYNRNALKNISIKTVKDLNNYSLILPSSGSSSAREKLDEYFEEENIKLQPTIETTTTELMLDMVRKGVGIGYFISDTINSQPDRENYEIITFNNDLPDVDICLAYIDEFVPIATKKFIELLKSKNYTEI